MLVAIADHLEVDVVLVRSSSHRRVEGLPRDLVSDQSVAGIDRDALGAVDCRGVAELGGAADILGGQGDHPLVTQMLDGDRPGVVDVDHLPPVTVLDPVGGTDPQPSIVGSGDHLVADGCLEAVGQAHASPGFGALEAVGAGALVQLSDQVSRGREHDRIAPLPSVEPPGVEHLVGHRGQVPNVYSLVVQIEAHGLWSTVAHRQRGGTLAGGAEAHELVQAQRALRGFDVAQHPTGTDRGELLVVTDQSHLRATLEREGDDRVQGEGVGHTGLVDDEQGVAVDGLGPGGEVGRRVFQGPHELGEGVRGHVDLLAQDGGGSGRGGQAQDLAAAVRPCVAQRTHGRRLARPGGRDGQLHARWRNGHLADQRGLASVERNAVRRRLQQREVDVGRVDGPPALAGAGGNDPLFRGQDVGGGVVRRPVDAVDALAVGAGERCWFRHRVVVAGQQHRVAVEDPSG